MNSTTSQESCKRSIDRLLYDPAAQTVTISSNELGLFGSIEMSGGQSEFASLGPRLELSTPTELGAWLFSQKFQGNRGCFQIPVADGAVFAQFKKQSDEPTPVIEISLELIAADQARTQLIHAAAFSHLVMRSGHEFLNHQNGIQMNARLIEIMNQNDNDTNREISSALDRLLSDSHRSVALFRALQEFERSLTATQQSQVSISVLQGLLAVVRGSQGRRVSLHLPKEQHLPSNYLLCLCVFLSELLSQPGEDVELSTNGSELVIGWTSSEKSEASLWVDYFNPLSESIVYSALPVSFCAWGLAFAGQSSTRSSSGVEHRLHLALP